jgi:iron-regulated transporter 1
VRARCRCACACSRSPARRFATSCASASDRAGATTAGLAAAEEEEEELDELLFFQLSSDILETELSLLKADAPPASGDSSLGITAVENGDSEDGRLSGGSQEEKPLLTRLSGLVRYLVGCYR